MPGTLDDPILGYAAFGLVKLAGYSLYACAIPRFYEKKLIVQLDSQGRVLEEHPCVRCGYILKTLPSKGKCPECGSAIVESLSVRVRENVDARRSHPLVVGLTRTVIGILFVAAYWAWAIPTIGPSVASPVLLAGLLPIRLVEWWILVRIFFDRKLKHCGADWRVVICGTILSYALDLPAILGLCIAGGLMIC